MALLTCNYYSETLRLQTGLTVAFPDNARLGELPVVYLLHGLSDNCSNWQRGVPVERYALKHRVAVVMPEVQRSWYTDMALGLDYFTYIHRELPEFCERLLGVSRKREQNYVMGLSMGGYGALKCALTQPFCYAGAASFSGSLSMQRRQDKMRADPDSLREWHAVTGSENELGAVVDLFALTRTAAAQPALPALYLTCGTEDFLYECNQQYRACMDEAGVAYRYEEWEGAHTWEFWQQSLEKAFAHFFPANK